MYNVTKTVLHIDGELYLSQFMRFRYVSHMRTAKTAGMRNEGDLMMT